MRHPVTFYSKILFSLCEKKSVKDFQAAFRAFLVYLKRNDDLRFLPAILRKFNAVFFKKFAMRRVLLEYGSEKDFEQKKMTLELEKIFSSKKERLYVRHLLRREFLGGIRITIDDTYQIDATIAKMVGKILN